MRWTLKQEPDSIKVNQLAKELGIEKTLAKILVQRNIDTFDKAKQFFRPS